MPKQYFPLEKIIVKETYFFIDLPARPNEKTAVIILEIH
ncbi:MAG: hypothetical protein ACI9DJ_000504 [Algoriphagus sp.]|jgi:hypothetical protein